MGQDKFISHLTEFQLFQLLDTARGTFRTTILDELRARGHMIKEGTDDGSRFGMLSEEANSRG